MRNNELVLVFFSGYLLEDSQVQAKQTPWLAAIFHGCHFHAPITWRTRWAGRMLLGWLRKSEERSSHVQSPPKVREDYRIGRTMPEAAARKEVQVAINKQSMSRRQRLRKALDSEKIAGACSIRDCKPPA